MEFVDPIKDPGTIEDIKSYLKVRSERNYILFMVGIHTGLQVNDLIRLQVKHVLKNEIRIKDRHTGHFIRRPLHADLKAALDAYTADKPPHEYLIKSRHGVNKPITKGQAYKIINKLEEPFNLENTGISSLRKTFGYHYYKQTGDAQTLQRLFNHAHPSSTLRYIGIIDRDENQAFLNVSFTDD